MSSAPNGDPGFVGRFGERRALDRLLDAARGGRGSVLVVRGEAGVGKSTLLRYCEDRAADFQVRRVIGVESEMELPFAALHQLCGPLLDRLDGVPPPQRTALEVALGLTSNEAAPRFLVALGALSLVSEAGTHQPILCVIDDVQWLDRASREAFGFIARRLLADSVAMLFAVRAAAPATELRGLPVLQLEGLGERDARALLESILLRRIDPGVRDRVIAEARGNPLALLELPRRLSPTQMPGALGLAHPSELPSAIETTYVDRLRSLPESARTLALVAAAEPADDPILVWRAVRRLGVETTAAAVTEAEGLLTIDEHVRFRHPLVRSAAYRSASAPDRRRAHLALAESLDDRVDADRRAWHLAAATAGPDEDVARDLEASAVRARTRGGLAAAAAYLRRSVALTEDPVRREGRALAAARASLHAGEFDAALDVLKVLDDHCSDELKQARVELLRGQIVLASGAAGQAAGLLLAAARRLDELDPALALEAYLDAWSAAFFAGTYTETSLRDVSNAASAAARRVSTLGTPELLLAGVSALETAGRTRAVPALRRAIRAVIEDPPAADRGMQWTILAAVAASELWDFESWARAVRTRAELARETGALGALAVSLSGLGLVLSWSGDLDGAERVAAESRLIGDVTGLQVTDAGRMLLTALRGKGDRAVQTLEAIGSRAVATRNGASLHVRDWTMAMLGNGLSRYEQAVDAAMRTWGAWPGSTPVFVGVWAMVELAEAALRVDRRDLAITARDRVLASAEASGTEWALGIAARTRALLEDGDAAETRYQEALLHLRQTPLAPELARGHLLYGEWLRRSGRRVDARAQLREAHTLFSRIGADGFAERTRLELVAAGAGPERRAARATDDLTVQEAQVARLAADGRTNVQIGNELYLSRHTIEWHLRKVYVKLGITSRFELRDALERRGERSAGGTPS